MQHHQRRSRERTAMPRVLEPTSRDGDKPVDRGCATGDIYDAVYFTRQLCSILHDRIAVAAACYADPDPGALPTEPS